MSKSSNCSGVIVERPSRVRSPIIAASDEPPRFGCVALNALEQIEGDARAFIISGTRVRLGSGPLPPAGIGCHAMTIQLTTCPPDQPHEVIEVVAAVGVSTKSFLSASDPGVAMASCRDGLRLRARKLGADMVVGCQFQLNFEPSAADVTGFGTTIRIS